MINQANNLTGDKEVSSALANYI